jgi:hypothetical protein
VIDVESYCRELEAYLCRKNDGHLVRIVGPSFDLVAGWAEQGVPFKVACRGIDRYFDRYYAKGPRRRPVRIEFCQADVLDLFDEWRRAVGVAVVRARGHSGEDGSDDEGAIADGRMRRRSLSAHVDRAIARLVSRGGDERQLSEVVAVTLRELDVVHKLAKRARGEARQTIVEGLRALDAALLRAARSDMEPAALEAVAAEADAELAPFRSRMPPEAYARARAASIDKIIRERERLPTLTFDN